MRQKKVESEREIAFSSFSSKKLVQAAHGTYASRAEENRAAACCLTMA